MEKPESDDLRSGQELLDFVTTRMKMSSFYQPLMIRTLIEHECRCSVEELARTFLLADEFEVARSRRIVMRWPHTTLTKIHGYTRYDKITREFLLPVTFKDEVQRQQIIGACTKAIQTWNQVEGPRAASKFFAVIEKAGGRCQACGVPGHIRPLDVDHIIPRAKAKQAKVYLGSTKSMILVDDPRNLQALCTRCNRGQARHIQHGLQAL